MSKRELIVIGVGVGDETYSVDVICERIDESFDHAFGTEKRFKWEWEIGQVSLHKQLVPISPEIRRAFEEQIADEWDELQEVLNNRGK